MGLLSDPSLTPRNKLGRSLSKHNNKICLVLYTAGLAWFVCLAHSEFNHSTYLSENALSPGLVYPEAKQDSSRLAQTLVEELRRERNDRKTATPHAWIVAKMMQIGLETHVHNFTLNVGDHEYQGKNIYGILRAPRIGSTEGIVFTAPYRPPSSVHSDLTASVPVLLAFAEFARKKNYWAKDLVFLVTEQEQLGMQAWLEAYHEGVGAHDSSILKSGSLPARAGALQAALNLEIQDLEIDYIDVKIEGLNGQLPNLDMFNLVQRITYREGIISGYKQTPRKRRRTNINTLEKNLKNMLAMLMSQATGVPNGNHGLFHRYRIESLTLEAVKRINSGNSNYNRNTAALPLLKTIEGISRSLNNLLERFHQSYFFYILVQNDRFVSIGDFMPCLILLVCPMFIKAFLLWLTAGDANANVVVNEEYKSAEPNKASRMRRDSENALIGVTLPYGRVLFYLGTSVGLSLLCNLAPLYQPIRDQLAASLNISTAGVVTLLLLVFGVLGVLLPLIVRLPHDSLQLLHIGTLIFLGVALIVVGLLNFALGFFVAVACIPLAIALSTESSNAYRCTLVRFWALLLHPLVAIYLVVLVLTLFQFPELSPGAIAASAANVTMDAFMFALMDYLIYGNWLYTVVTAVFFPLWTLCWTIALSRCTKAHAPKLKSN